MYRDFNIYVFVYIVCMRICMYEDFNIYVFVRACVYMCVSLYVVSLDQ